MVSSLSHDIAGNVRGGSERYELRQTSGFRENHNQMREEIDLGLKQERIEEARKRWVASSEGVKLIHDMYHPFM